MVDRPCENDSPDMAGAIPERRPATEEISGLIERVTFDNGSVYSDSPRCPEVRLGEITTDLLQARLWTSSGVPTIREVEIGIPSGVLVGGSTFVVRACVSRTAPGPGLQVPPPRRRTSR